MHKTYLVSIIYSILIVASFIVPRFVGRTGEGFVPAAEAVMIFLIFHFIAGILATYQFFDTYRTRHKLTRPQAIAGMLPLGITILGAVVLFTIFRY